jgi:glycine cleavage system transcriptional repressor
MTTEYLVISALGHDRVGLVDDLAASVAAQGCNIEESKMAVLGGEFAVIMLISGRAGQIAAFSALAPRLSGDLGLHLELRATGAPRSGAGRPYLIESVSLDTPGILHSLTSVLKQEGINIEDLETETCAAPWTGVPMFVMKVRISLPADKPVAQVRRRIEELAVQQDLDIKLEAVSGIQTSSV